MPRFRTLTHHVEARRTRVVERVLTPGGWVTAMPGDWITTTGMGAGDVIRDRDFRAWYEPTDEASRREFERCP